MAAIDAVGGEEQAALGQGVTGEMKQRDRPGEPGEVRQFAVAETRSPHPAR